MILRFGNGLRCDQRQKRGSEKLISKPLALEFGGAGEGRTLAPVTQPNGLAIMMLYWLNTSDLDSL